MKKIVFFVCLAFSILLCLNSCGKIVRPATPFPDNVGFAFCGAELQDSTSGIIRYPTENLLSLEPPIGIGNVEGVQNETAPKERTISINGVDYTLPYLTSRYRINEPEPFDIYESATQESRIYASFLPNGGGLVSFSDSPLYEYKFTETDLSENGAEYFQNLADQAIRQYYKANPAAYRVSVETEQHLSREDGGRSPSYEGFVSEQQDLSYSLCVRNYCFTYTKYAKNTPTQETIQVKVRQDGRIVWLSTWYPGSMDAYTDFEVPEDKIREAAEQVIRDSVNPELVKDLECKGGTVSLWLDPNGSPYFRVQMNIQAVLSETGENGEDLVCEYTDTLFMRPVFPDENPNP